MKMATYFFMSFVVTLISLAGNFASPAYSTNTNLRVTVVPTRTPYKFFFEFKKADLNTVPPADILEQVSFFGGGGGVICNPGISHVKPVISSDPQDGVLMTQSSLIVCGWKKGEVLKGTIIYPNGAILTKSITVLPNEGMYYGDLSFTPGISDPVGNYTFILEGALGSVKEVANFKKPVGPHLFVVDSKTIMFYGFSPQEKVRFFNYGFESGKFIGWQEYKMDETGQLILKSSVPYDGYFWAVGKTGEAQLPRKHHLNGGTVYPSSQITIKKISCGDRPSRINSTLHGYIAFTKNGGDLRFHSEPGLAKPVIAKVPEGTEFRVTGGPKCADGLTWWKISVSNPNAEGWAAESYKGEYLLAP
ncbi:MAG: SH3 domain-containing protein [Anaerolineales bacterium]|nr:SH3 domain-containing protein [Anaerolineales bacterium]